MCVIKPLTKHHDPKTYWKKHPELMPDWVKEGNKAKKDGRR
jgi:hypothetical protein